MRVRIVAYPRSETITMEVHYKPNWHSMWTFCGRFTDWTNRDGVTITALALATEFAAKVKDATHITEL